MRNENNQRSDGKPNRLSSYSSSSSLWHKFPSFTVTDQTEETSSTFAVSVLAIALFLSDGERDGKPNPLSLLPCLREEIVAPCYEKGRNGFCSVDPRTGLRKKCRFLPGSDPRLPDHGLFTASFPSTTRWGRTCTSATRSPS